MQLGIRLHDVNAAVPETLQTLEARAATAREEGFRCAPGPFQVHQECEL